MPALIRPRLRRGMTFVAATRRKIQQFGPYKSLAVLLVPLLVVDTREDGRSGVRGPRPLGWRSLHDRWRLCRRTLGGRSPFSSRKIQTLHDAVVRGSGATNSNEACAMEVETSGSAVAGRSGCRSSDRGTGSKAFAVAGTFLALAG